MEQTLESFELCCLVRCVRVVMGRWGRHGANHPTDSFLPFTPTHKQKMTQVETFPDKHESVEDFLETLKYAFLYAKTVTLGPTHWPKTNSVMLRNRRIGCSMSGLAQVRGVTSLGGDCAIFVVSL